MKSHTDYTVSLNFDQRLYRHDITGSIVHAKMLAKQGIISHEESTILIGGLDSIFEEIESGSFPWITELEDLHMNVEHRLRQLVGQDIAGKLHTGRSRNDQVALDTRMYLKDHIREVSKNLINLQWVLVDMAESHRSVLMPGYTHLQRAQPVLFSHHLLAYFQMFKRDHARLEDCYARTDVLPLGSGALAGVPYLIDRQYLAKELGFSQTSANSMDAVSDRDFLIEYQACASICMMHMSRLAEEIILWSSLEFGFIRLDDAFVTGSSMMPQKRNPDFAELARGKTGRVYGNLIGILTVLKGLPLTYNRDLQEDKESTFDTCDTLLGTINVFTEMVKTMQIDDARLLDAVSGGYMLATDLADYLVMQKGVPFREAYGIVSDVCKYAFDKGKNIEELTIDEYRLFCKDFNEDVLLISAQSSIDARDVEGGTSLSQVDNSILLAREFLNRHT